MAKKAVRMPLNDFLDENKSSSWADSAEDDWSRDERTDRGGYGDRRDGGYDDRRGGYDDRRGGYDDRRGGYDDRRGGYDDRRGGYDDRRGGYDDRRGGYDDRRGGYDDRRGGYDDRRGGYDDRRGGYDDRRGGYDDRRGGYDDRRGGYDDRRRESKPIPTEPPFTAYVGNFPYDVTDDDVIKHFRDSKVVSVRLMRERDTQRLKGYGYVEFEDAASLEAALSLDGESLLGRNLRIDVADGAPKEAALGRADKVDVWERGKGIPADKERGGWGGHSRGHDRDRDRDRGGWGGRRDYGNSFGGGDRRGGRRYDDRYNRNDRYDRGGRFGDRDRDRGYGYGDSNQERERPKLKLQPRSVEAPVAAVADTNSRSSIFGGAKPRDESKVKQQKSEATEAPEAPRKASESSPVVPKKEKKEEEPSNRFAALAIQD